MTTEPFEPVTVGLPNERPLHVISMQLAKREAHVTTTSMAMSWRAGCTQEEALGSAMLSATQQKPGFSVEQWLIYTFEATDHAR